MNNGFTVLVNINQYLGVESEVSRALGMTQDLDPSGPDVESEGTDAELHEVRRVVPSEEEFGRAVRVGGVRGLTLLQEAWRQTPIIGASQEARACPRTARRIGREYRHPLPQSVSFTSMDQVIRD